MRRLIGCLVVLGMASMAANASSLEWTDTVDLGGGMGGYTLTALGQDAPLMKSFFVALTVECLAPGVDTIHQLQAVLPPFTYDINDETAADLYNGYGGYDKARDSWYGSPFYTDGSIQIQTWDVCLMHLESGTKPEVAYYQDAKVAYIALTGQAHVYGVLFREGAPFPFDFIIPEPATMRLIAAGATLIIRRRR